MWTILLVGIGGFFGANARYFVSDWVGQRFVTSTGLTPPFGTLVVNVLGSFFLALFLIWASERVSVSLEVRLLVATGFFGAFTTFSTYATESILLMRDGAFIVGIFNILLNNGLCLFGVVAGLWLGSRL